MLHTTNYTAIGLMSGSSLDGLDICHVQFSVHSTQASNKLIDSIDYQILQADCIEYTNEFRERLRNASTLSAFEFAQLHTELGNYFGTLTNNFIQKNKIKNLDFIVSHGQTIFHQPLNGFTSQIGCGAQLAAQTQQKVICDLRTSDIAYGGQGAPIVPIAEKYLFKDFSIFLNIGGIANISFHEKNSHSFSIHAYDVCAGNTLLNYLVQQKDFDFDDKGNIARSGKINYDLLAALNNIEFCKSNAPKSLGSEHIYQYWIPLVENYSISIEDKLATTVEHIAIQVGNAVQKQNLDATAKMLVTGGGAFNVFLIERIQFYISNKIIVPDTNTIQYKEALAMAFIGLLRILEIPNCVSSVTGARKEVIGGAVYLP